MVKTTVDIPDSYDMKVKILQMQRKDIRKEKTLEFIIKEYLDKCTQITYKIDLNRE